MLALPWLGPPRVLQPEGHQNSYMVSQVSKYEQSSEKEESYVDCHVLDLEVTASLCLLLEYIAGVGQLAWWAFSPVVTMSTSLMDAPDLDF